MKAGAVTVTIDGLIVEGVGLDAARRLGASLERALAELILSRGLPAGLQAAGELPRMSLAGLELGSAARPEILGATLADRLYTRLDAPLATGPGDE